jgi:hypothetical protein
MTTLLGNNIEFRFPIRKAADATRFKPTPDPTVDFALKPDDTSFVPVLTWDSVNLEYVYILSAVDQIGSYCISILVSDPLAESKVYDADEDVIAVPAGLTATQVRIEMDANSTKLDVAVSTRSTLTATQVWANGTRTLTAFGTLVADIWAYATRTLTAFGFGNVVITLVSPVDEKGNIGPIYQNTSYYAAEKSRPDLEHLRQHLPRRSYSQSSGRRPDNSRCSRFYRSNGHC